MAEERGVYVGMTDGRFKVHCTVASAQWATYCVQCCLAIIAMVVSSRILYLADGEDADCVSSRKLCIGRWGLWMSPPTSFWSGVAAVLNMLALKRSDRRLTIIASDLQILVSVMSAVLCGFIGWQMIAYNLPHSVYLSMAMGLQSVTSTCGAYFGREARKTTTPVNSFDALPPLKRRKSRSLPRGWRYCSTLDGQCYFEHKRTGKVQWEMPDAMCKSSPPLWSQEDAEQGNALRDHSPLDRPSSRGRRSRSTPRTELMSIWEASSWAEAGHSEYQAVGQNSDLDDEIVRSPRAMVDSASCNYRSPTSAPGRCQSSSDNS